MLKKSGIKSKISFLTVLSFYGLKHEVYGVLRKLNSKGKEFYKREIQNNENWFHYDFTNNFEECAEALKSRDWFFRSGGQCINNAEISMPWSSNDILVTN
jgi:hypothetical protein